MAGNSGELIVFLNKNKKMRNTIYKAIVVLSVLAFSVCAFGQTESVGYHAANLGNGHKISTARQAECEPRISFSEWLAVDTTHCKSQVCKMSILGHEWVYAEWEDVNDLAATFIHSGIYTLCPDDRTENEARVCRVCRLHQKRTKSTRYQIVERKSEYIRLIDEQ